MKSTVRIITAVLGALVMIFSPSLSADADVASPAAVIPNPGGIGSPSASGIESAPVFVHDVFETGLDRRVAMWHYDERIVSRTDLGGVATSGTASNLGAAANLVMVRGTDNALWYRSRTSTGWAGWRSLGGALTARPATDGTIVLVRGTDGQLWEKVRTGGAFSASWRPIGGSPVGGAAVANGRAYIRGTDNQVWTATRSEAGTWSGWQRLAAMPAGMHAVSEPAVSSIDDVLVRGSDGACWMHTRESGWTNLGGRFISGFAAVHHSDGVVGRRLVYGRGTNGRVYSSVGDGGWRVLGS